MEIRVKGKNVEVQPAIKEYVEEKIGRLDRYLENLIMSVEVELTTEKNPSIAENQTIEVTIVTKGPLIRAKESSIDMHASADKVVAKLERQIKKYKEKIYSSSSLHKNGHLRLRATPPIVESEEMSIARRKQVQVKPMTPEEAALQMDLLGHEFFVFKNSDTEEINVIYKRRDENYGLIEPQ